MLYGNSGISKNEGTSLWSFVPNSGLEHFATASRSCCQQNSSTTEYRDLCWRHLGPNLLAVISEERLVPEIPVSLSKLVLGFIIQRSCWGMLSPFQNAVWTSRSTWALYRRTSLVHAGQNSVAWICSVFAVQPAPIVVQQFARFPLTQPVLHRLCWSVSWRNKRGINTARPDARCPRGPDAGFAIISDDGGAVRAT